MLLSASGTLGLAAEPRNKAVCSFPGRPVNKCLSQSLQPMGGEGNGRGKRYVHNTTTHLHIVPRLFLNVEKAVYSPLAAIFLFSFSVCLLLKAPVVLYNTLIENVPPSQHRWSQCVPLSKLKHDVHVCGVHGQ